MRGAYICAYIYIYIYILAPINLEHSLCGALCKGYNKYLSLRYSDEILT